MAVDSMKKPAPAAKSPNCRRARGEEKMDCGSRGGAPWDAVDVDKDPAIWNCGCKSAIDFSDLLW